MAESKTSHHLKWLNTYLVTASKGYAIGRSIGRHSEIFIKSKSYDFGVFLQKAVQDKVLLSLAKFYEEKGEDKYDKYSVHALAKYIGKQAKRIKVIDRARAFEFLEIEDSGQSREWINRAVTSKVVKIIRNGENKSRLEALKFYRDNDVAHKQRFNKRKAPKLRWNDTLKLIHDGQKIINILDDIYLKFGFSIEDPEKAEIGNKMNSFLDKSCDL